MSGAKQTQIKSKPTKVKKTGTIKKVKPVIPSKSTNNPIRKSLTSNPFMNLAHRNRNAMLHLYDKRIPDKQFRVGVIITTHGSNSQRMCKRALESCIKHIHHPKHIFVFDNESSDGWTHKIPRNYPDVNYIRIDDQIANGGLTATWNEGAKRSLELGCRVILFLNNDAYVNESINDMITASGVKVNAMIGPLTNEPGFIKNGFKNQCIRHNELQLKYSCHKIKEHVNGFCFAVNRGALLKNKFSDEYFFDPAYPFGGNETEWARRFAKNKKVGENGGSFFVCNSCYVEHDKQKTWRRIIHKIADQEK